MRTIIGHETIREQLARIAKMPQAPQSFLLAGPQHVGKRMVALWFARELMGVAEDIADPLDLLKIAPEVVETTKQSREKTIPVEVIRELKHFLSRSPSIGKRRVVMIDKAEKLSTEAANALLKILEEPPHSSVLILITSEPEHLPATILSRLFPVSFRPLSSEVLRKAFPEARDLPQFFFDLGLPGVIVETLEASETFQVKKEWLRSLFQISKLPLSARIQLAETLAKNESTAKDLLEIWSLGLMFQARERVAAEASGRYTLVAEVLITVRQLVQGEGAFRSALERLLLRFP
jgi:DNA polymerase-3 subunit delta'